MSAAAAATTVRIFMAHQGGEAAARLRAAGYVPRPEDAGTSPLDHGAFQWADAAGLTDASERSLFSQAFVRELDRLRSDRAAMAPHDAGHQAGNSPNMNGGSPT